MSQSEKKIQVRKKVKHIIKINQQRKQFQQ